MNRAAPGGNSHEVRSESFLPCAARYLSCGNHLWDGCPAAPGGNSHEVQSESFLPCAARYLSYGNSMSGQCVTQRPG